MKIKKIIIVLLIIISTITMIEFVFRNYVAVTSERPTLVRNNWLKKYWLINSMGYRDFDYSSEELKNKKIILIVGDSVTAGYGIKDYKNRYPDILQEKIGSKWQIINISQPGWNIQEKIRGILSYPDKERVKLIIIQYYFDDLRSEIFNYCGEPPIKDTDWSIPESCFYTIVRKSYFINYIYWRLYEVTYLFRKNQIRKLFSYLDCEKDNRGKISNDFFYNVKDVIDLCEKDKIKLVVLNVPLLEFKGEIRHKINNLWEGIQTTFVKNNIPTIDMTSQYNEYNVSSLRVNSSDSHPNEKAHKIIADCLFYELTKMNLIPTKQI